MLGTLIQDKRIIRLLSIVAFIIIFLNVVNELAGKPFWQICRLIDLGGESNFPTWFSSVMLLIAAFFAYKCSLIIAQNNRLGYRMWQLLALGFLGMSCEEVAMVHENYELALEKHFSFKGNWTVTLGFFALLVALIFVINFKKYVENSKQAKRLLTLGAILYIFGAFVLEATYNFIDSVSYKQFFIIENIIEESLEMFGVIVIIKGLMEHCKFLSAGGAIG